MTKKTKYTKISRAFRNSDLFEIIEKAIHQDINLFVYSSALLDYSNQIFSENVSTISFDLIGKEVDWEEFEYYILTESCLQYITHEEVEGFGFELFYDTFDFSFQLDFKPHTNLIMSQDRNLKGVPLRSGDLDLQSGNPYKVKDFYILDSDIQKLNNEPLLIEYKESTQKTSIETLPEKKERLFFKGLTKYLINEIEKDAEYLSNKSDTNLKKFLSNSGKFTPTKLAKEFYDMSNSYFEDFFYDNSESMAKKISKLLKTEKIDSED